MKFIWEPNDIVSGVIVGKNGRKERWMIGYSPGIDSTGTKYSLISLSDGLIADGYQFLTKEQMVIKLNNCREIPEKYLI